MYIRMCYLILYTDPLLWCVFTTYVLKCVPSPLTDTVFNLSDLEAAVSGLPDHEYSLHLTSTSQARPAVLVFAGLPNSLLRLLSPDQFDFSRFNVSSGLEGNLLASFTHPPLSDASAVLRASFLSVLYYDSGIAKHSPKKGGFNMTVKVTGPFNDSYTSSRHNRVSCHELMILN